MTDKKPHPRKVKRPAGNTDEPAPSALNLVPGVEDSHDGLPGAANRSIGGSAPPRRLLSTQEYVDGVLSGDRTLLARAITLIESNALTHFEKAQEVVHALLPRRRDAIRVGITGPPGAGKSSFIETLGTQLTAKGHKVAVTAVDPSSSVSGGSILGDKTRMETLAADPKAFIRPSPTGGTLGGVTRKTRETVLLFEAAGYDVILIETVGVGQSETVVRSLVDFFLLVLIAGAGDELQGIKKGVIELADALLINKADGNNVQPAELARAEFARALHYLKPATRGWQTRAFCASALTGEGIPEIWRVVERFQKIAQACGVFSERRRQQECEWMHALVAEQLTDIFQRNQLVGDLLPDLEQQVGEGTLSATAAAQRLIEAFRRG